VLAQLSDFHVRVGPGDTRSARRLAVAVDAVAGLDPAPDAVLVSGDLVDVPSEQAYARVRELLAPLEMPVHAIPGNHDDRDLLRAAFGPDGGGAGAPIRHAASCGPLRLVACDTTRPGRDDGRLDGDELRWLDEQLAADPGTPTVVAMHHPPLTTGIRAIDAIALPMADRAALAEVLGRHPQAGLVTCGHAHRAALGTLAGRPVLICPSTEVQLLLDLRPRDDLGFQLAERDPRGFALHVLLDGGITSHVVPLDPVG
jgi:3',5'-cyclic AMP phosphodiesterase CpdA